MDREDRIDRAKELLDDIQEKQAACNKVIGLSFKDIDRVLRAVISEKASKRNEDDEEQDMHPDKWGVQSRHERDERPPREINPNKSPVGLPYTPDEVSWLLSQRDVILSEEPRSKSLRTYKSYSPIEADALIKGNCHPSIFKRKS